MGKRGPEPRSGQSFQGRPIVVYGGFPAVRWPEHPLARQGLVTLHRLVASEKLGRALRRDERVRWKDGNVWNWASSNLEVVPQAAPILATPARPRPPAEAKVRRRPRPPAEAKVRRRPKQGSSTRARQP